MTEPRDYRVGYGSPPIATRFKKGQSGNPTGRPKGARNISTVIAKALSERVYVTVNGRRRSITKIEAAATQLANQAATGDQRAAKLLLDLLHNTEAHELGQVSVQPTSPDALAELDRAVLEALRARVRDNPDEVP